MMTIIATFGKNVCMFHFYSQYSQAEASARAEVGANTNKEVLIHFKENWSQKTVHYVPFIMIIPFLKCIIFDVLKMKAKVNVIQIGDKMQFIAIK